MKTQQIRFATVLAILLIVLPAVLPEISNPYHANSGTVSPVLVDQQPSSSSPIKEFSIPTTNSGPNAIVYASNNVLWFVQYNVGKIGELFPQSGVIKEFNMTAVANPASLAIDGSGNIWFTEQKNPSIWELNTSNGVFHQYPTNIPNSTPVFVIAESSNRVWFTDTTANYIRSVDPATNITSAPYYLPTSNSGPAEIAVQNQSGASYLWITESFANKIARFDTTTHIFQEFTPSVSLLSPVGITVDKSGYVWVSEHGGSSIVELIPSNSTFRKYPTSQPSNLKITAPATIALDQLGRLWFVEHFSNKVGRLDPKAGVMSEFNIPTSGLAYSLLNSLDPSGNFWFTEYTSNKIGMIQSNATAPVSITSTLVSGVPEVVDAGQSVTSVVSLYTNQSNSISIKLNVTSTFTAYSQTSNAELSLSNYTLTLSVSRPGTLTAVITPDAGLSSGLYAAGVEATYGNYSVIKIVFLQVRGSSSILGLIITYLPIIALVAAVVLLVTWVLINRGRRRAPTIPVGKPPIGTVIIVTLALVTLATRAIPDAAAKCIGLPPPPPGSGQTGPDYLGLPLDIGSLAFFALVVYLLIRDRMRKKGQGQQ